MTETDKILEVVKQMGAETYKQGKEWNGNKVYVPVYARTSYVGLPLVIFEDENGLRLSTPDEAIDYVNATTIFNEDGEPIEEETSDRKFTSWKNPHNN